MKNKLKLACIQNNSVHIRMLYVQVRIGTYRPYQVVHIEIENPGNKYKYKLFMKIENLSDPYSSDGFDIQSELFEWIQIND